MPENDVPFRDLVDAIPQIVWTADAEGHLTYVNAQAAAYAGLPAAELLGQRWDAGVHPDDHGVFIAARSEAVRTGKSPEFSFRLRRADGAYRWHVSRQTARRAADGTVLGWFGTCTDIEDLKQTQRALHDADARLREAQRVAGIGSWRWDPASDRVWWSDEEYALFGADPATVFPSFAAFLWLVHPSYRTTAVARVEAMRRGVDECADDLLLVLQDGSERWIHSRARATRAADGTILRVDGTDHDITERRRAEIAAQAAAALLREQEMLVREAAELTKVGGWGFDPVTLRSDWTPEVARMYGMDPAVPLSVQRALECYTAEQRPVLEAALAASIQHGTPHDLELQLTSVDGVTRWVRTICRPIVEGGRVVRVRGSLQDITDRKQAESALAASEHRYRQLVNTLPTAVLIHDGERVLYCNPAFVQLVGAASADEVQGRALFDCVHPDDRPQVRARLAAMIGSNVGVPGIEIRLRHADGRAVPTYSVSTPIAGYGPRAFLIALSDLTERERATQQLRAVLGSVSDAILTIDARGVIQSANPASARQFGYEVDTLIGMNVNALIPEPHQSAHAGHLAAYQRTDQGKVIGAARQVEGLRRDGTRFPAELTVTEYMLDGEQRFTGVLRDISARIRLEEQFRQSQKMEAVGRLAGGVAHDFNNLLTVINGYCELLLSAPLADDGQREPLASIRDAGERASRLTRQLLAFGRKAVVEPKVIDLNELVEESARLLRRLLGEDIILIVAPAATPVRVKADPSHLEQVIINLAVNSRDAMPTGGRLTIETSIGANDSVSAGHGARLTIADTGHGMTDEVRRSIFEPFFTTKAVGQGTGLGLAVVDGVVAQCGGRISVESTVGAGTTFRVWLPLVTEEPTAADIPTPIAGRGSETVLLVEDEDAVRRVVRHALELQGFTVLEANGGPAAVRQAQAHQGEIHLLISDVVMPVMGGREVLEEVRRHRPGVPALFMSGYTDDAVLRHGVVQSAGAFIEKPFTPLALARKVRQVLDSPAV